MQAQQLSQLPMALLLKQLLRVMLQYHKLRTLQHAAAQCRCSNASRSSSSQWSQRQTSSSSSLSTSRKQQLFSSSSSSNMT